MLKNVDQRVALVGFVHRRPVGDAFHSVTLEDGYSVVAEAGFELSQFALSCMVDAKLKYRCGGTFVLLRSPQSCGKNRSGGNCLEQSSSFHGRDSNSCKSGQAGRKKISICEKTGTFQQFHFGKLEWIWGTPSPLGSTGIMELGEIYKVIYGAQQLRGKILSRKDLGPVGILFIARFRLGYDLLFRV